MVNGLNNERLTLTNRNVPLGIYRKGLGGTLNRVAIPKEEKGTFNVVPAQTTDGLREKYILDIINETGRPVDEVTRAYDQSLAEIRGNTGY